MNKIRGFTVGILALLSILAIATQNVSAVSTPTMSLIDTSPGVNPIMQAHTTFYVNPGGTINLTLYIQNVSSLWSWKVNVTWDNSKLQLSPTNSVSEGPFLSTNGTSTTLFAETPPTAGTITEVSSTLLENSSVTGSGALLYISFAPQTAAVPFTTTINIAGVRILNTSGTDITAMAPISDTITVHFTGDINGDNKVDIRDISLVAKAFGSVPGSPGWNPVCDVNYDGTVNIKDISIVAKLFGTLYP